MSNSASSEALIERLTGTLQPMRPLSPPWLRASIWLGIVAVVAIVFARFSDLPSVGERLTGAADMWLALSGAVATAILSSIAAFQLNVPDRSPRWALLPLPGLLLWLGASGLGCLRSWLLPDASNADAAEATHCFKFIVMTSLPLSVLLLLMLRRGFSLRPKLTALLGGLAAASAAASLITFFHPYDATATDLGIHLVAVGIVIILNLMLGNQALKRQLQRLGTLMRRGR